MFSSMSLVGRLPAFVYLYYSATEYLINTGTTYSVRKLVLLAGIDMEVGRCDSHLALNHLFPGHCECTLRWVGNTFALAMECRVETEGFHDIGYNAFKEVHSGSQPTQLRSSAQNGLLLRYGDAPTLLPCYVHILYMLQIVQT